MFGPVDQTIALTTFSKRQRLVQSPKEPYCCLSTIIVPQLSKCLKFEAVWGVLTDQMI